MRARVCGVRSYRDGLPGIETARRDPTLTASTEGHPRISQGPDKLRRAPSLVPSDCARQQPPHQEEPKHLHSKWCGCPTNPSAELGRELYPSDRASVGIVSAPLWDSKHSTFAGLLTSTDYINVIQYYCQFPDKIDEVDQFRLSSLRGTLLSWRRAAGVTRANRNLADIEKAIGVLPLETLSVHPMQPLYDACRSMLKTRARRIPLVDVDDETGRETVVSVITQYRILKFIAVNNEKHTVLLKKTVREIGLGTYTNLATTDMGASVLDVIHLMVKYNISAVPIVDKTYRVLNVFEAVDVIPCIKGGVYEELSSSVGEALSKRAEDFPGIYTCSEDDRLDSIFDTIRRSRVHRLIVVDDENKLKGMISLSDILKYVLLHGEEEDNLPAPS